MPIATAACAVACGNASVAAVSTAQQGCSDRDLLSRGTQCPQDATQGRNATKNDVLRKIAPGMAEKSVLHCGGLHGY